MEKVNTNFLCWGFLLGVILANGLVLKRWCQRDTQPLSWDESIHTQLALDYNDRMKTGSFASLLMPAYFNYPPLYHLILGRAIGRTNDITDTGALVNFFFLSGLIVVVNLLGRHLMGPMEGLAASLIVSIYPSVIELTRSTMIDLSLTFWVALSVYFLLRTDGFRSLGWSSAFGISVGLGLLTKWSALIYLLGPIGWAMVESFHHKSFKGFFLAIGLALLVSGPWYASNLFPVLAMFKRVTHLPPAGGQVFEGWKSWLWYPFSLSEATSIFLALLIFPGLAVFFWKPRQLPVFLWFVVSIFCFSCITNRNIRYLVPALPAAALLSVAWLPSERRIPMLMTFAGAVIIFGFTHLGQARRWVVNIGSHPLVLFQNQPPIAGDWKHKEVIERVNELKSKPGSLARVVVLSNAPHFHSTTLNVSCESLGFRDVTFLGPSKSRWLDFDEFVLLKTGDLGPEFSLGNIHPAADLVLNPPGWFKKSYREAGRWGLPDGSEAVLYQVSPVPLKQMEAGVLNISLKEFNLPNVAVENFRLKAEPLSADQTAVGRLKSLTLECGKFIYKQIPFDRVSVKFVKPQMNLHRFLETGEIQFFSVEALQLKAEISSQLLIDYASQKVRWLKDPSVTFEGEMIRLAGKAGGLPLEVTLNFHATDSTLSTKFMKARIAGVPLPSIFFRGLTDRSIPLTPNPDLPFYLELNGLKAAGTFLKVGVS